MAGVIAALTGPIGIAIAVIAALIAIGTALYLNWDKICQWAATMKENVTTSWNNLKSNIGSAVENIKSNVKQKFDDIKSSAEEKVENLKSSVKQKFDDIKSGIEEKVEGAKSTVTQKFDDIKSKIQEKIEGARDKVRDAIDKIKSFFDFSWSLPDLKLPHPYITGEFSLNPPSVPHFGIDWYKTGGVFDAPSVIGVGEAGSEAVVPLTEFWKKLEELADRIERSNDRQAAAMYAALIEALSRMSFSIDGREFARLLREHGVKV